MSRRLLGVAAMVVSGLVYAQDQAPPPPKEPVLMRAPERSEWTVTYRYDLEKARKDILEPDEKGKSEAAPTPAEQKSYGSAFPVELKVSKDGTTYREVTTWSDGSRTEKWADNGLQVRGVSGGRVVRVMPPAGYYAEEYSDYSQSDFEDFQWVEKANYVGPGTMEKAQVYGFATTGDKKRLTPRENAAAKNDVPMSELKNPNRKYVAYLNVSNQLPVYLDDGQSIRTYVFTTPTGKLELPPEFAAALEAWRAKIKKSTAVPLPP